MQAVAAGVAGQVLDSLGLNIPGVNGQGVNRGQGADPGTRTSINTTTNNNINTNNNGQYQVANNGAPPD